MSCPTRDAFQKLVAGNVSSELCDELVDHIAGCPRCAQMAERILEESALGKVLHAQPALNVSLPEVDVEQILSRFRERVNRRRGSDAPTVNAGASDAETVSGLEIERELIEMLSPPETDDEMGRLGGYRILKTLGVGGMGVVFLAEDSRLKRLVAFKVMRRSLAASRANRQRFMREAQAMAAVEHEHIVHINQVGEDRGVPYLAMQYVRGESLDDWLTRDSKLSVADSVRVAREIAEGLAAAHRQGLIHRDIKPSNIWLAGSRRSVKILDFGLARSIQEDTQLTRSGDILGTPAYMSPEQANGERVDGRSDLFSLGCLLYRMCTGKQPFQAANTTAVLLAVINHNPQPPIQIDIGVPAALSQFVLRLLAKTADMRPESAEVVVDELRAIEASLHPRSAPETAQSISKRTPRTKALALGLLGLAVIVAGIVIIRIKNRDGSTTVLQTSAEEVSIETDGPVRVDVKARKAPQASRAAPISKSPFDQLKRSAIPANELTAAGNGNPALAPPELVAVDGDSRLKHWAAVNDVAFTQDGRLLVSASDDSTVRLWDTGTGNMIRQLNTEGASRCLALSPDGRSVAAGFHGSSIRIWEIATGQPLQTLTPKQESLNEVWSLAISSNAEAPLLAAAHQYSGQISIWNPDTGLELRNIAANQKTIVGLSFSLDGKWLASAGGDDGTTKTWNAETGELQHTFSSKGFVGGVAFTPDGEQLVVASREEITIWDRDSGELLQAIPESAGRFALTPGGDGILFARGYQALLLKFDSPHEPRVIGWNYMNLSAVAISPDGQHIATAGSGMPLPCNDGAVRLWDIKDGRELHPSSGHASAVNCLALRTDSEIPLIASGSTDQTVRLWDPALGRQIRTLSRAGHVNHVSFQPKGRNLVAGHDRHNVLWDSETGEKQQEWALDGWALCGAFTPDARALLGGCMDGNVYQWNTSSGELVQKIDAATNDPNSVISTLAIDRTGRFLALANYERGPHRYDFKLWDLQTNTELHSLDHGCPIRSAAFSPDGRRLATAGEWDNTAKIWDVETGTLLQTLKGHQYWLNSVCFSPDGTRMATSARDGTVRVWDHWDSPAETTVRSIRLGPAFGCVNQVVFSDDGRHLVTANGNGTLYVLQAPRLAESANTEALGTTRNDVQRRDGSRNPFDGLTRENLPELLDMEGRPVELPQEVVAVFGTRNPPKFRRNSSVALSPDEKTVAFMPSDYQVTLWDVASGQARRTLDVAPTWGRVDSIAFDPDGRVISVASGTSGVQRWDVATGELLETLLAAESKRWLQIEAAPERPLLAMQSEGPANGPIVVWDLAEHREHWRILAGESLRSSALSPDGRFMAVGHDAAGGGLMELWDVDSGKKVTEWRGRFAVAGLKFTRWQKTVSFHRSAAHRVGCRQQARNKAIDAWIQLDLSYGRDERW